MTSQTLSSLFLCILLTGLLSTGALAAPLTPESDQTATAVASLARPGSVLLVTTFDPNAVENGQCSLIEAIVNANDDAATHVDCASGAGPDTIELPAGLYALNAVHHVGNGNNGLPSITSAVAIDGNGATVTQMARSATSPGLQIRIFHVVAGGDLTLNDLTISNGTATEGGRCCAPRAAR